MAGDIVGRESELAAFDTLLASARDEPAAVVIEGEPGIGKTSLWRECVGRAESRSWRVLRSWPAEAETKLSYAGLTDLLGPVADQELAELVEVQRHALQVALVRVGTDHAANLAPSPPGSSPCWLDWPKSARSLLRSMTCNGWIRIPPARSSSRSVAFHPRWSSFSPGAATAGRPRPLGSSGRCRPSAWSASCWGRSRSPHCARF